MSLPLPPKPLVGCDASTAQTIHNQLTSVIAGHPQATTTYRFYEELDSWLGPWGIQGYPIGYGKFYNIVFTHNKKLMDNPTTKQWVWRTTIYLQEALRDFLVNKIRDCSLPRLTESQLRKAAFDSHPKAYDRGGLSTVVMVAPELTPVIATIPFVDPRTYTENFDPTVKQIFITLGLVVPKVIGGGLAAAAGPAHTGTLRRSVQQDQRQFLNQITISQNLIRLKNIINQGKLDHIQWLEHTIAQLNATQFSDQGLARAAREVIQVAETRKRLLIKDLNTLLNKSPETRSLVLKKFPNILSSSKR